MDNKLKPHWKMVKFGDVVRNANLVERDPEAAGIDKIVGLDDLDSGNLHIRRWNDAREGTSFTRKFTPGQALFGKRRAYQHKVAYAEFEGICSGDILTFESKDKDALLPELLPFICQTEAFFEYALGTSAGSLSPRTSWGALSDFEFALPPIEEQKSIAEILWAADEAIQSYETALEKTNQLLDVIRETVVCDGRFEQCKLGGILTSIVAGKSVSGASTPARPDEYGVLKVSAVGPNGFDPIENKRLIDQSEFLPQYRVRRNSLLITRCNTTDLVGRVCLTENDDSNLMLCDKTLELVPDESKLSKLLLFEVLRSRGLRTQIRSRATGTGGAMKNISQDDIRSLVVPIPDGQTVIAGRVLAVTDRIGSINQHLSLMRNVAKQLSNELMPGRGADHV